MKCKDSNFWIGLGIGSVAGALAYHFSRTEKAKKLEDAICRAIHKANGEAKEFINTAEEEALHVGTKVADKMAHEAHEAADGLTQNELNLLIIKDAYLCKSV